MTFPFLTVFLIFILWLTYRLNKSKHKTEEQADDFWAKEREANSTPAKDISSLSYITIPIDKFPINFSSDPDIVEIEEELKELATHRLLNLTGVSNTDLKLTYGVPNFETMSKIGEDFDRLTILLNSYGKAIIAAGQEEKAIPVLEFAVGIKTDVSESYVLLAECYKNTENENKLGFLRTQVEESSLVLKEKILEAI